MATWGWWHGRLTKWTNRRFEQCTGYNCYFSQWPFTIFCPGTCLNWILYMSRGYMTRFRVKNGPQKNVTTSLDYVCKSTCSILSLLMKTMGKALALSILHLYSNSETWDDSLRVLPHLPPWKANKNLPLLEFQEYWKWMQMCSMLGQHGKGCS